MRLVWSFSPLHSGQATAIGFATAVLAKSDVFQSPPFGASHCNLPSTLVEARHNRLSVPYIRGKPLQSDFQDSQEEVPSAFQSPPFGASHCNFRVLIDNKTN